MLGRRDFIKLAGMGTLGLAMPNYKELKKQIKIDKKYFSKIPSPDYYNISHKPIEWKSASDGLDFSRTEVYRDDKLVDVIATIKINPEKNKIRVFNGKDETNLKIDFVEDWQKETGALAMINGSQYLEDYSPRALVICDGKQKGPKYNKYARGMLVAEPKNLEGKLKKADLLDFEYDSFDYKITPYAQGVQHWPILLDREGKIKVKSTLWQANRTIVAKTKEDEILFMTTEGGYFTLYNIGKFLKESNQRKDNGFNIHTAMNMDGGPSSEMIVKSPDLEYLNYGGFVRHDPKTDGNFYNFKEYIPEVIGVFKKD